MRYNKSMKINNKNIVKDNLNKIREKSIEVKLPLSEEDRNILTSLLKYVVDSTVPEIAEAEDLRPAVGIAAIQVGINKKLIAVVLKDEDGEIECQYALANPRIVSHSVEKAYLASGEGCLSVENEHRGYVHRYRRIKVKAYDMLQDKDIVIQAKDYLAMVLQHEIDHFSGILYYDHINKENPFSEEENAFRID